MDDRNRKKILIIKLSAFGDIVLATPHIEVLMQYHAKDEVVLLTSENFIELFSAFDFQQIWSITKGSLSSLLSASLKVIKARFDVVYDLQTNDRSALLVMCSFAARRIGMGHRSIYTHHEISHNYKRHVFIRTEELFQTLGLPPAKTRPLIGVTDRDKTYVTEWLKENNPGRFVIVHAGCSKRWLSKRWPDYYFVELAKMLEAIHINVLWIGTEEERELNKKLAQQIGCDATGVFDFKQLVELGRNALAAVVNDSGPMHLLAASSIPVFGIFGPTDLERSHAVGQRDNVLHHSVECSPCYLEICPEERGHACMTGLKPADVYQHITRKLQLN